jgi:hypothetical protein
MPSWLAVTSVLVTFVLAAGPTERQRPARDAALDVAELWSAPDDLAERDLLTGPGGEAGRPDADAPFAFVAYKTSGVNSGYDVRDPAGRDWSVKLGEEAQSEVTVSRLLWAIGFHQPAVYFVPAWTLTGTDAGPKPAARFRLNEAGWTADEEWDWYENPFIDAQPFRGLVVAQMLLANWDLKPSNNRIYQATDSSGTPRRRYVVRDLGSSLGSPKQHPFFAFIGTRGSQGTKNDIAGFERRGFITDVDGSRPSSPPATWCGPASCWRASPMRNGRRHFRPAAMPRTSPPATSPRSRRRLPKVWRLLPLPLPLGASGVRR